MDTNNLNNLTISKMNLDDLTSIRETLSTDFDNFWNYSVFKSELENPNSIYFIISTDTEIVGFAGIIVVFDIADITNIVIKKSYRGNKLSIMLLDHIIDYCKKINISQINLEVNSNNITAINLYNKFGFKQVGLRKNYYSNGDALLFSKIINK